MKILIKKSYNGQNLVIEHNVSSKTVTVTHNGQLQTEHDDYEILDPKDNDVLEVEFEKSGITVRSRK